MTDVNLGYLAATTLQKYQKSLPDNIFKKHVLLDHLKENDGIEYHSGGRQIVVPLMYGVNSSVMAFSGTDNLNVDYQDGIDAATYEWRKYNVSVIITKEDELMNKGREQVVSLIKAKIMQAENSLAERLNNDLFNGVDANKEITGIETAVETGTYGGIAGASYSWWQAYEENTGATLTIPHIRTGMNTVNLGNGGKCSIMVTTQLLHEKYESLLSATLQMNPIVSSKELKRMGDAGIPALGFRGVPVVFDEAVAAGEWYFLNTENFKLHVHKDANFEVIKKAEPSDQHVSVQHIMFMGNTGVNRRKSLGKLTAKTSS